MSIILTIIFLVWARHKTDLTGGLGWFTLILFGVLIDIIILATLLGVK